MSRRRCLPIAVAGLRQIHLPPELVSQPLLAEGALQKSVIPCRKTASHSLFAGGTKVYDFCARSAGSYMICTDNKVPSPPLRRPDGCGKNPRWVFWAFHLNTNQKDARAHAGVREDSRGHTFPAKVSPPFLKRRVGVFSTRTPHRPNPIGVSLCKVSAERAETPAS